MMLNKTKLLRLGWLALAAMLGWLAAKLPTSAARARLRAAPSPRSYQRKTKAFRGKPGHEMPSTRPQGDVTRGRSPTIQQRRCRRSAPWTEGEMRDGGGVAGPGRVIEKAYADSS